MAKDFSSLQIWQVSHKLMLTIYDVTASFPKAEEFNLTSQIRRAALSIPTNIAEASGRYHDQETIHFIYNARGSSEEVRSLLLAAHDLKYLSKVKYNELEKAYERLIISINSFIKSIRAKNSSNQSTNQPIN
jgi:four helix bundle protein